MSSYADKTRKKVCENSEKDKDKKNIDTTLWIIFINNNCLMYKNVIILHDAHVSI